MIDYRNPLSDHPDNIGLAFWLFLPGGNRWPDSSRKTFGGNLIGNPVWTPTPVGFGIKLSGSGQYVDTAMNDLSGDGAIFWWMNPSTSSYMTWWGQISANGTGGEFSAQRFSDGNLYVGWSVSSDQRVIIPANSSNYQSGVWQRYALCWQQGGQSRLYRNGVLIGTNGGVTNTSSLANRPWRYGRQGEITGAAEFSGTLGTLRIIKGRNVSTNEVIRDYQFSQGDDPRIRKLKLLRR